MSQITDAIAAVRAAASSAGNVSGNADGALFYIEKCGAVRETIRNLEWAEANHRDTGYKIKAALDAVRKFAEGADNATE